MRLIHYITLIFWIACSINASTAQESNAVSIRASATVVEIQEIELVTIKDLELDESMAIEGIIYIAAQSDSRSGLMLIKGRPGAQIRFSYLPEAILENELGNGVIKFNYEVYGYQEDNQNASEPIDAMERTLRFNTLGHYFIWIGGRIDISNAQSGSYSGEFTIEIEYI